MRWRGVSEILWCGDGGAVKCADCDGGDGGVVW